MPQLLNNIYRVERKLQEGGFGKVFLARENVSNRLVAIKQLHDQDPARQRAIIHEMQMVSRFNHPNIVTYHHHFSENGLLFIVMEYCAAGSLRDAIHNRKVRPTDALSWVQTLAETLAFVHAQQIVHHDIKPDNLLLTDNGTLKISDFGIANTGAGTRAYMSPEALAYDSTCVLDARVDTYALGVTLMELLIGQNPFFFKSPEEILAMHDKGDFPIKSLPSWQQEIILKSINKVPELRFQSMADFAAAIRSRHVPLLLNKETIHAGELAEKAQKSLATKKWARAGSLLEFAQSKYPDSVPVLRALAKYYLMRQKIPEAQATYERALKLNPRLDVQKDLGWLNLASQNYPAAISLLTDHIHRNPSDFEAYNLLLQCLYETGRYEAGIALADTVLEIDRYHPCFDANRYLCILMHRVGVAVPHFTFEGQPSNPFVDYNYSVITESLPTHSGESKPTLKSKLLFMDYRFRKLTGAPIFISDVPSKKDPLPINKAIISFGREGYDANDFRIPGATAVSRRHCVVVNCRDDVWLYDLASTGTWANGQRVKGKVPVIGRTVLRIGSKEFVLTSDKANLI